MASRLEQDLGAEISQVDCRVYARYHGDSGCGWHSYQFRMEADAGEQLLLKAGFRSGDKWVHNVYAVDSPEEFPLFWRPYWTGSDVIPFQRRDGHDRAWIDRDWGVVYFEYDGCLPPSRRRRKPASR